MSKAFLQGVAQLTEALDNLEEDQNDPGLVRKSDVRQRWFDDLWRRGYRPSMELQSAGVTMTEGFEPGSRPTFEVGGVKIFGVRSYRISESCQKQSAVTLTLDCYLTNPGGEIRIQNGTQRAKGGS